MRLRNTCYPRLFGAVESDAVIEALGMSRIIMIVILAAFVLPARALDGTPSPNIHPPTNPQKCWVATGIIADVFARCVEPSATPVRRPAVTPESGHALEQPDRKGVTR